MDFSMMTANDWLTLIALVAVPIGAVLIGQQLQNRAKMRDDKMEVFEELMASRVFGVTPQSVRAANMIHIVYSDDKNVRDKWSDYYKTLCIVDPDAEDLAAIQKKEREMLTAMAVSLGYGSDLVREALDTKYVPKGMIDAMERNARQQDAQATAVQEINRRLFAGEAFPRL